MLRWFPWRWIVSRVARARGLVDPVRILSRLESFAQPMEVKEPLELLRAGLVFHARGPRKKAKKRVRSSGTPHDGLLPAGFSAERLGPNDDYYWDAWWGVAGLRAAAALLERYGDGGAAQRCRREADDLLAAIEASLETAAARLGRPAMPASPYRRLDAGAVVADAGVADAVVETAEAVPV